jgi:asparagine synthase (glutamine-hydrolysing)
MLRSMIHRGPDHQGMEILPRVGLGNARLSIVDIAGGDQPIANEDLSIWIVFNGEIYNHPELRADLAGRGHRFRTRCDTEVIVHLYEEFGEDCVHYLNGQYAFAIWDETRRQIFGARDRLGIRPYFYALDKGSLLFASTVGSLFSSGRIPRALDPEGLRAAFTFWTPLPGRTVFRNIREVPPGCCFRWDARRGIEIRRYWDLHFPAEKDIPPRTEIGWRGAADDLRTLLLDAVRLRLRADVPVGAYLSGGIDSAVIAHLVHQTHAPGLNTFSIGFESSLFDEKHYQDIMAERIGSRHHRIVPSGDELAGAFPMVVHHSEQCLLRTAPVPLYFLSGLVREKGFKVVLTGEGADEFLGGYNIFKENRIRRFWARQADSTMRPRLLARLYPFMGDARGRAGVFWTRFFRNGLENTTDPFYSHRIRWAEGAVLSRFLHPDHLQSPFDAEEELRAGLPGGFTGWDPLCQAQYLEAKLFLPGYLLSSQGDRMMMANSVEGRFPFLDHRVVEFANSLHPQLKLDVLNEKYILKKAFGAQLPAEILTRPKQPYRAPSIARFVLSRQRRLVDYYLSPKALTEAEIFNPAAVGRLLDKLTRSGEAETGNRDTMAFLAVLSTQILFQHLVCGSEVKPPVSLTTV